MNAPDTTTPGAEKLLEYLTRQLVGPAGGNCEELDAEDLPDAHYTLAILHPKAVPSESVQSEQLEDSVASDVDGDTDEPVATAYQFMPASAGISFYVTGKPELNVKVWGARYVFREGAKKRRDGKWVHSWIADPGSPEVHQVAPGTVESVTVQVLKGAAELHVRWRPMKGGWLATTTLINAEQSAGDRRTDNERCIFQAGLECAPAGGSLRPYPSPRLVEPDEEELELAMLYRHSPTWAAGHGCASVWDSDSDLPGWVRMSFLPHAEVKPVTTKAPEGELAYDTDVLRMQFLQDESVAAKDLKKKLLSFLASYEKWHQLRGMDSVPEEFEETKAQNLNRVAEAIERIREGIEVVTSDSVARKCFALANRAMLMQMVHAGKDFGGTDKARRKTKFAEPDYFGEDFGGFRWRPFQLAFQLLVIPSLMDPKRPDRKAVDLLWFPTGGGKTEAYLALAAFEMLRRRLQQGNKGLGTAIIKRYTLRLLTSQQFQRAAGLICAMERIRASDKTGLGHEPFTLGLWVGEGLSPNKFAGDGEDSKGAFNQYEALIDAEKPENPYQLSQCPWCGTRLVPSSKSEDLNDYGVRATTTSFEFYCPTDSCPFHERLPVNVVDEHLFDHPPSFVIGTIDKFARLAWDERAKSFFGTSADGEQATDPPSLIIQDELHLISGPLGTIAGIYEAAIDTVIGSLGTDPKIVAATATIRRAADQVQRLYAREHRQFPPSGTSVEDSYFAKVARNERGRVYAGLMAQGVTSVTSLVHTCAALTQSLMEIDPDDPEKDTWWTQLVYHNSKRELGKTMTLARDDIPSRVQVIARDQSKMRANLNVVELSASVSGSRLPDVLADLGKPWDSKDAIDILPCTSMISVGVDVNRLGLMVVNGQPKTTAEYIQASSRIGRDKDRPSGLVIAHYSWTKPRDRSHYESFFPYHNALYREVEPTSVTPCAPPALARALHAALVIVVRMAAGLSSNESAGDFDPGDPAVKSTMARLERRISAAEPEEAARVSASLRRLAREWHESADTAPGKPRLRYRSSGGRQFTSLLVGFEGGGSGLWRTLNSMRHVDTPSRIRLLGEENER
ncbi:MAG: hypothetical protein K8I27_01360 [Planctomycetes bacterium]|nr:hypothetical protein [Planctomycetota bacterium]